MNNLKNPLKNNFTMISNEVVQDSNLSDRARFIYCYMASMPDDWVFYQASLAKSLGYSRDTLQKYMNELLSAGVLTRKQEKNGTKFANYTYELMDYKKQEPKFSATEKSRNGNFPQREFSATEKVDTNKETLKQRNIKDKEIVKTNTAQSQAIDASQAQALDDTREQEPVKPAKKTLAKKEDWSKRIIELFNVPEQVAQDFIAMRKAKRAVITETALSNILREVQKVNQSGMTYYPFEAITEMILRNWSGFKADWIIERQAQKTTFSNKKGAIDGFLARTATKTDAPVELDVTPSQNWPQVDFLDDNPFA
jgi:predicted transcriptional regulator